MSLSLLCYEMVSYNIFDTEFPADIRNDAYMYYGTHSALVQLYKIITAI